jgi:PAS domain S-box-containing protein
VPEKGALVAVGMKRPRTEFENGAPSASPSTSPSITDLSNAPSPSPNALYSSLSRALAHGAVPSLSQLATNALVPSFAAFPVAIAQSASLSASSQSLPRSLSTSSSSNSLSSAFLSSLSSFTPTLSPTDSTSSSDYTSAGSFRDSSPLGSTHADSSPLPALYPFSQPLPLPLSVQQRIFAPSHSHSHSYAHPPSQRTPMQLVVADEGDESSQPGALPPIETKPKRSTRSAKAKVKTIKAKSATNGSGNSNASNGSGSSNGHGKTKQEKDHTDDDKNDDSDERIEGEKESNGNGDAERSTRGSKGPKAKSESNKPPSKRARKNPETEALTPRSLRALRLQKHNESEIRRRTKINSCFDVLAHMISATDPPKAKPKIMALTIDRIRNLERRLARATDENSTLRQQLNLGPAPTFELDNDDDSEAPSTTSSVSSSASSFGSASSASSPSSRSASAAANIRTRSASDAKAAETKTHPDQHTCAPAASERQLALEAAFVGSTAAIGITSTRGQVIDANPAFCHLLGYTRDEIIGNALMPFTITHPSSLPMTFQYLSLLLEGKQPLVRVDKRYNCKDGRVLVARLSVWTTHDRSGNTANLINLIEPLDYLPAPIASAS